MSTCTYEISANVPFHIGQNVYMKVETVGDLPWGVASVTIKAHRLIYQNGNAVNEYQIENLSHRVHEVWRHESRFADDPLKLLK
jgi:hypothetical protein